MSKNDLLKKLLNTGTLQHTSILSESEVFAKTFVQTDIPMLNVALSGRLDGGLTSGVTSIAGESKSFKTMFSLLMMKAYFDKYEDAIAIMYDNEFGSPPSYLESAGIDTARVIHCPFTNIEELNFDLTAKLERVERGQHVFFFIDSIGNAASKKEAQDAKNQNSAEDMTRAKKIKSMFRIITPYFSIKDIPLVAVQHTYSEQGMYPKEIVSGGRGVMLSSDTVWIISKSQVKEEGELSGYNFNINIEKSRFVKEKSRIPITVRFDRGVDTWSGLFEVGLQLGFIKQTKQGWYARQFLDKKTGELVSEDKNWRKADTNSKEFWTELLSKSDFYGAVKKEFALRNDIQMIDPNLKDVLSIFESENKDD